MRLYRRGLVGDKKNWIEYEGPRSIEAVSRFMHNEVGKRHLHTGATFHEMFTEGCKISGNLEVARVPGTVHFQAQHTQEKVLNLAFTNVSHIVHKFTFGEGDDASFSKKLPSEYQ